jgi:NAD(P)-dependent dehydrogenase (short-subunit alcohol dehydrogenase family)
LSANAEIRTALITGGTRGIGTGCAAAFVSQGYHVVICADDAVEFGSDVALRISAGGPGTCHYIECDVRDRSAIEDLVRDSMSTLGRLDTLVNNVGINYLGRTLEEIRLEEIDDLVAVNLVSCILLSRLALPHLRAVRGSIVNIGSLAGAIGHDMAAVYAATKGGISAFSKALAIEECRSGVRVNTILPGNVLTDSRASLERGMASPQIYHDYVETWQWLGRSATPAEIGQACLFLASEQASYVTGIDLPVTGGAELGFGPKQRTELDNETRRALHAKGTGR